MYKQILLILAIIFIVVAAILFFVHEIPTPPYVAGVVLGIGLVFLVFWAVLVCIAEYRSK